MPETVVSIDEVFDVVEENSPLLKLRDFNVLEELGAPNLLELIDTVGRVALDMEEHKLVAYFHESFSNGPIHSEQGKSTDLQKGLFYAISYYIPHLVWNFSRDDLEAFFFPGHSSSEFYHRGKFLSEGLDSGMTTITEIVSQIASLIDFTVNRSTALLDAVVARGVQMECLHFGKLLEIPSETISLTEIYETIFDRFELPSLPKPDVDEALKAYDFEENGYPKPRNYRDELNIFEGEDNGGAIRAGVEMLVGVIYDFRHFIEVDESFDTQKAKRSEEKIRDKIRNSLEPAIKKKRDHISLMQGKIDEVVNKITSLIFYSSQFSIASAYEDVPTDEHAVTLCIHTMEFNDHVVAGDFSGYVERFDRGAYIMERVSYGISELKKLVDDAQTWRSYQDIFFEGVNRKESRLMDLTGDGFVEVWAHAHENGWDDALVQSTPKSKYFRKGSPHFDVLVKQKTRSLVDLLTSEPFAHLFDDEPGDIDYEMATQFYELDDSLFRHAYNAMNVVADGNAFLSSLLRLRQSASDDALDLTFTSDEVYIVSESSSFSDESVEASVYALGHLVDLQETLTYGLAGVEVSSLTEIEDLEAFVCWFYSSRDDIHEKLTTARDVDPLVGEHSPMVHETIQMVYGGLNGNADYFIEFAKKHMGHDTLTYHRLLEVFSVVDSPRQFFRNRNVLNAVTFHAYTDHFSNWNRMVEDAKSMSPDQFVDTYRVSAEELARKEDKRSKDVVLLSQAYEAVQDHSDYHSVADALVQLRRDGRIKTNDLSLFVGALDENAFEVAKFVSTEVAQGMSLDVAREIFENYKTDFDFHDVHPSQLFEW